jgi:DNA repair exonuclease SbcCD ATPase subunit
MSSAAGEAAAAAATAATATAPSSSSSARRREGGGGGGGRKQQPAWNISTKTGKRGGSDDRAHGRHRNSEGEHQDDGNEQSKPDPSRIEATKVEVKEIIARIKARQRVEELKTTVQGAQDGLETEDEGDVFLIQQEEARIREKQEFLEQELCNLRLHKSEVRRKRLEQQLRSEARAKLDQKRQYIDEEVAALCAERRRKVEAISHFQAYLQEKIEHLCTIYEEVDTKIVEIDSSYRKLEEDLRAVGRRDLDEAIEYEEQNILRILKEDAVGSDHQEAGASGGGATS